ncbi:hypothetical protein PR001_g11044 [Phytophthora rubi]|uniref:Uncharacterized protein n=1 Tax=Phytophthora rubi TaxID=129364 RepID=A0A6A3M3Z7_9STRA|nr:hypothetical protein PR002_g10875 [Phytophthora rubi]KAE9031321.1 hypothetical protein PR001_g11044 [Phytophthora rubi]
MILYVLFRPSCRAVLDCNNCWPCGTILISSKKFNVFAISPDNDPTRAAGPPAPFTTNLSAAAAALVSPKSEITTSAAASACSAHELASDASRRRIRRSRQPASSSASPQAPRAASRTPAGGVQRAVEVRASDGRDTADALFRVHDQRLGRLAGSSATAASLE